MGYRSQVAVVLTVADYAYGLKWMTNYKIPDVDNLLHPTVADKVIERGGKIIIYYDSIKWYKYFNWFDSMIHLYTFLYGIGSDRYSVLRVGENAEDIELEGNVDELYEAEVYPVSMIELNEWKEDIEVDAERAAKLVEEDQYYHIYCKMGKPKGGDSSWVVW